MGPGVFEGVLQIKTDCEAYPVQALRVAGEVVAT